MDGNGSTPQGTESIPKKPPLHRQLTGLFSMKGQISEDKENSGDGSQIRKFWRLSLNSQKRE